MAGGEAGMTRSRHVAVLGAGIMGCSTALFLARRGVRVALIDRAPAPFTGASRWNEGKIHLGFLYAADPSLETARRILPGGLTFAPLVRSLIGCDPAPATTADDDIYLVHRDSVVSAAATADYFERVAGLVREHPAARDYLVEVDDCWARALSDAEVEALAAPGSVAAGFRVPERSVSTNWVADRFVAALTAEPRIELAMGTRVLAAAPLAASPEGAWQVDTTAGRFGPFDGVVNALWEGRLAVDHALGLAPKDRWTHRFRLSLFVRTDRRLDVPSLVLATGPFGDIKNYNGRDFYLSWYPAGLIAEGGEVSPPRLKDLDDAASERIKTAILDNLASRIPAAGKIARHAATATLAGGWVFAMGTGSLADPGSTLHQRDRVGIRRHGHYLSVDTGKYSIAPWLAQTIAEWIGGGI